MSRCGVQAGVARAPRLDRTFQVILGGTRRGMRSIQVTRRGIRINQAARINKSRRRKVSGKK